MAQPRLPPGWEWDFDGKRWFYTYKPNGHVQYHFPSEGDEFPEYVDDDGGDADSKLEAGASEQRPDDKKKGRCVKGGDSESTTAIEKPSSQVRPIIVDQPKDKPDRQLAKPIISIEDKHEQKSIKDGIKREPAAGSAICMEDVEVSAVKEPSPLPPPTIIREKVYDDSTQSESLNRTMRRMNQEILDALSSNTGNTGEEALLNEMVPAPLVRRPVGSSSEAKTHVGRPQPQPQSQFSKTRSISPPDLHESSTTTTTFDPVGIIAEMATEHTAAARVEIHPPPVEIDGTMVESIEQSILSELSTSNLNTSSSRQPAIPPSDPGYRAFGPISSSSSSNNSLNAVSKSLLPQKRSEARPKSIASESINSSSEISEDDSRSVPAALRPPATTGYRKSMPPKFSHEETASICVAQAISLTRVPSVLRPARARAPSQGQEGSQVRGDGVAAMRHQSMPIVPSKGVRARSHSLQGQHGGQVYLGQVQPLTINRTSQVYHPDVTKLTPPIDSSRQSGFIGQVDRHQANIPQALRINNPSSTSTQAFSILSESISPLNPPDAAGKVSLKSTPQPLNPHSITVSPVCSATGSQSSITQKVSVPSTGYSVNSQDTFTPSPDSRSQESRSAARNQARQSFTETSTGRNPPPVPDKIPLNSAVGSYFPPVEACIQNPQYDRTRGYSMPSRPLEQQQDASSQGMAPQVGGLSVPESSHQSEARGRSNSLQEQRKASSPLPQGPGTPAALGRIEEHGESSTSNFRGPEMPRLVKRHTTSSSTHPYQNTQTSTPTSVSNSPAPSMVSSLSMTTSPPNTTSSYSQQHPISAVSPQSYPMPPTALPPPPPRIPQDHHATMLTKTTPPPRVNTQQQPPSASLASPQQPWTPQMTLPQMASSMLEKARRVSLPAQATPSGAPTEKERRWSRWLKGSSAKVVQKSGASSSRTTPQSSASMERVSMSGPVLGPAQATHRQGQIAPPGQGLPVNYQQQHMHSSSPRHSWAPNSQAAPPSSQFNQTQAPKGDPAAARVSSMFSNNNIPAKGLQGGHPSSGKATYRWG